MKLHAYRVHYTPKDKVADLYVIAGSALAARVFIRAARYGDADFRHIPDGDAIAAKYGRAAIVTDCPADLRALGGGE